MSSYNKEVHKTIVDAIAAGHYNKSAAQMAGINERTLGKWLNLGKHEDPKYVQLYIDCQRAQSKAIDRALTTVNHAMETMKDPKIALEFLERRDTDWGKKSQVNISLEDKSKKLLNALERRLPKDVFIQVLEAFAETEEDSDDCDE